VLQMSLTDNQHDIESKNGAVVRKTHVRNPNHESAVRFVTLFAFIFTCGTFNRSDYIV